MYFGNLLALWAPIFDSLTSGAEWLARSLGTRVAVADDALAQLARFGALPIAAVVEAPSQLGGTHFVIDRRLWHGILGRDGDS